MREADKYLKIVEWSEEDGCFVGSCPALIYGGVHGANEIEVYKELCEVVEESIKILKEEGKKLPQPKTLKSYSGKLNLRMKPETHKLIDIKSQMEGLSINQYINRELEKVI